MNNGMGPEIWGSDKQHYRQGKYGASDTRDGRPTAIRGTRVAVGPTGTTGRRSVRLRRRAAHMPWAGAAPVLLPLVFVVIGDWAPDAVHQGRAEQIHPVHQTIPTNRGRRPNLRENKNQTACRQGAAGKNKTQTSAPGKEQQERIEGGGKAK